MPQVRDRLICVEIERRPYRGLRLDEWMISKVLSVLNSILSKIKWNIEISSSKIPRSSFHEVSIAHEIQSVGG
jgi:hypothetical protein